MRTGAGATVTRPRTDPEGKRIWFDETDFSYGANVPQEQHDSQEPQDLQDFHDWQDLKDCNGRTGINTDFHCGNPADLMVLPLGQYLRLAKDYSGCQLEKREGDRWRSPLFHFARLCKAHPALKNKSSSEAMEMVEAEMRFWPDCTEACTTWEQFFPDAENGDAACVDFMNSWDAVRHVPFQGGLQAAKELAEKYPLSPLPNRGALYPPFVSIAGWLQREREEQPIMLPTRTIARLLGCSPRTVSSLRKFAIADGFLTEVKKHRFRSSGGKSEATEFRFAVEQFPILRDKP